MKLIAIISMVFTMTVSTSISNAQFKNVKTETAKIYGNCGMCKETIEKTGSIAKVAQVEWDKDSQTATLTYDSKSTTSDEILKRVALAGYDSDHFLAPNEVYAKLPTCCQYEREAKPTTNDKAMAISDQEHGHTPTAPEQHKADTDQQDPSLIGVLDAYYAIKDALVKTDAQVAGTKATELLAVIKKIDHTKLGSKAHNVWMKVQQSLSTHTAQIAKSKDIASQREAFALLSKDMYLIAKSTKHATPVYYQNCPMYNKAKGANWLSKESAIKNPYYGSKMMSCGSTVETLAK